MGSASTYRRSAFGGVEGRALKEGDVLAGRLGGAEERAERALGRPFPANLDQPVRVVMGPQADAFTEEARRRFLEAAFRVSPQADRMGYRLEGPELCHAGSYDIVSDAVIPGSVQVPGSRQPIVMMVDCQTTGGYPKIATVISADLPVLARRGPGSLVRFTAVSRNEAENIRREQQAMLQAWIGDFRAVAEGPELDVRRLYEANLIDGVKNALD
jgi:allophanate hydrolase